jgi:HSP20 family protein
MTYYISPYRRLASLRSAMNQMMEETMAETPQSEREMMLAVDVEADDEGYRIHALVPGLDSDDLDIEILNNTVTIRGEFKTRTQDEAKYLVRELPAGQFSRVITLPTAIDATKTEASIKDGVLALSVPKAEAHRPKTIKVTSK